MPKSKHSGHKKVKRSGPKRSGSKHSGHKKAKHSGHKSPQHPQAKAVKQIIATVYKAGEVHGAKVAAAALHGVAKKKKKKSKKSKKSHSKK